MFNFKKIASVASSALMIGSTVALAAAANYPAPFVQNGNADVAIVTGQNAASSDTTAAVALSSDLSAAFAAQGGSSSTNVGAPSGDSVLLAKASDKINLGNAITSVFGQTVSDDDLPELLAEGTYTNDNNDDFDFEQRITLGSGLVFEYFTDSDYNDREPTLGFNLTSGQLLLNYSMDFTDDAESTVTSGDLVDLETTDLTLLGKTYYVSDADNSTLTLTLLDTANTAIAREGETTSVTVGSTSYEVGITFISPTSVKFSVNGVQTPLLNEGETYKVAANTYLGVKEILARDVAGSLGQAEFSIGSGKLEITPGQGIKLNDDNIQQVTAEVKRGSASGGKEFIDRINLVWTLDNDAFITPTNELVLPGFEAVKFTLADVSESDSEMTTVEAGGSDYIRLHTTIKDGAIDLPLLYANSTGEYAGIGKSSSELLVTSSQAPAAGLIYNYTRGDRMFVASWNTSSEAESYVLKFDSFSNDNGVNETILYKKEDNSWSEVKDNLKAGDTATLGSLTLTINSVSPYNDRTVNVTGNAGTSWSTLYTADGLKVFLPVGSATTNTSTSPSPGQISFNATDPNMRSAGHGFDSFRVVFVEENKDEDIAAGSQFNVTVDDNSNGEVEASTITTGRSTITDPEDSNHVMSHVYSDMGAFLERTGQSSDQRVVTVNYYGEQLSADLYLAEGSAMSSGGSTGALGNIVVTDSQVSSMSTRHLIVLGGSCVNTAAAQLLGASAPACGADFTSRSGGVSSGQFLIQSFNSPWSNGKVALLVAGYNAEDTGNAATYLRTNKPDTAAGKKYVGTTATSAELVTA